MSDFDPKIYFDFDSTKITANFGVPEDYVRETTDKIHDLYHKYKNPVECMSHAVELAGSDAQLRFVLFVFGMIVAGHKPHIEIDIDTVLVKKEEKPKAYQEKGPVNKHWN
jgi:hypothetical protein